MDGNADSFRMRRRAQGGFAGRSTRRPEKPGNLRGNVTTSTHPQAERAAGTQKGLIWFLAALVGFGPASIDMYLPGFLDIARDLHTSYDNVQLTLSMFLVGFAVGQFVIGPLSDRFGRRPILIWGISLYCVSSLLCAASPGIESFIALRLLQAIGGCAGNVIARAVVRDVYSGSGSARAMSLLMVVSAITPLVAPIAGTYVVLWGGWRALFVVLSLFGVACLAGTLFFYRETLPEDRRTALNVVSTLKSYRAIFANRQSVGYVLAGGMAFATMFAYISGAPGVLMGHFGLSRQMFSLVFAVNIAGLASGSMLNTRVVHKFGADRMLAWGTTFSALATIALFAVGWIGIGGFILFTMVQFLAVCSLHLIYANAIAGLLEHYPRLAGTASALFGVAQFGFGAAAGALVGQFFAGGTRSMVAVMLATALLSFVARKFLARAGAAAQNP
jgi:MFS transporter, DHA1 family, multidrug resistance protein